MAMTEQVQPGQPERPQRADRRRRQAGQDGQRVDEALVEDAEHDIDRQDRAAISRPWLASESWKVLAVPAKRRRERRRQVDLAA